MCLKGLIGMAKEECLTRDHTARRPRVIMIRRRGWLVAPEKRLEVSALMVGTGVSCIVSVNWTGEIARFKHEVGDSDVMAATPANQRPS